MQLIICAPRRHKADLWLTVSGWLWVAYGAGIIATTLWLFG